MEESQSVEQANVPAEPVNETANESAILPEKEKHPIPEGSVVTEEMVAAYESYYKCNRDIAIGSLLAWEQARTPLESRFVDLEIAFNTGIFAPLRAAYYAKLGQPEAPLSVNQETATQEEKEKVQEAVNDAKAETEAAGDFTGAEQPEVNPGQAEDVSVESSASTSEKAAE